MFRFYHALWIRKPFNFRYKSKEVLQGFGLSRLRVLKQCGRITLKTILALSVVACGGNSAKRMITQEIKPPVSGYVGSIAADEPQAVLAARDVLVRGGNAADAATALGFALTVTLPSRASLGGGGACLAYRPGESAQAFLFLPRPSQASVSADRPAAIPMLARGLYLMHMRYGHANIDDILKLTRNMAQNGVTVSQALVNDLSAVQRPLFSDPAVRQLFTRPDGSVLQAGDILFQSHLGIVYDRLITAGIGDLYIGALGASYAKGANLAGGGLSFEELRGALPIEVPALSIKKGKRVVYFLPPPADGGLGMAMAWKALLGHQSDIVSISQEVVAKWRSEHSLVFRKSAILEQQQTAQNWINQGEAGSGTLPPLPASTSFTVVDREGESVSCALTMNNLFGTGRINGTTGIIMASSPATVPQPLLTAAISTYNHRFQSAIGASGQRDAAAAGAEALVSLLNHGQKKSASITHLNTPQGRVNAVYCAAGLPGDRDSCRAFTDSKGSGLALSRH